MTTLSGPSLCTMSTIARQLIRARDGSITTLPMFDAVTSIRSSGAVGVGVLAVRVQRLYV